MLGQDLVRELEHLGTILPVDLEECDITDPLQTASVVKEFQPDLVVHAAAYTRVDDCETDTENAFRTNVTGTENVAEACRNNDAWMIYFSSDYVFDGTLNRGYTEQDNPNPISQYGRSKLEGERCVQKHLPGQSLIIRTSWLFGIYGENFIKTILKIASETPHLTIVDDQVGSPTYTRDLAAGVGTLVERDARGLYNMTNTGETSWYGFARYFVKKIYPKVTLDPISTDQYPRPASRPAYSVLAPGKLIQDFQFTLPHWQDAVDRYLAETRSISG